MDSLKELYLHYERVKAKIEEYEKKPILSNSEVKDYREWIALAGNLCERIFDLENKGKFHGFDGERNDRVRQQAFGDWVKKIETEKDFGITAEEKDFREK